MNPNFNFRQGATTSKADLPPMSERSRFWTGWVAESSAWEDNPDNRRRAEVVLAAIDGFVRPHDRVLDVGCGTGWMTRQLGRRSDRVTGQDLASDAMDALRRTHPQVTWIGGDFVTVALNEPAYEAIVCMETISHVPDQKAFAARIVQLLAPGGKLILTTQNPYVWHRTSWLEPTKAGQLRNWPTRDRLRELFGQGLTIQSIETCAPGGDLGIPRLAHNPVTRRLAERALGIDRWFRVREALELGRSIVLVGRRA
jgi:SAM-dependent methyltransferase